MDDLKTTLGKILAELAIDPAVQERICSAFIPVLEKNQERLDFLNARTLKDKSIAINLLNQAIDDLQKKQEEIEEVNQTLLLQKLQLEEQSRQLRESLDRLEMSYEELEQFSYIASHDLKSPLRTIASYAQLLQRRYGGQLGEEADEFLQYITSGARQMNDIIKDLLEYSFIQEQKEMFADIDMNEIMGMVKFNLHSELADTQTQLHIGPLPSVMQASKSGMVQLFQNLLSNAIKFQSEEPPEIRITAEDVDTHWKFTVKDNGIGLDESFSKKVFLPFQRLTDRSLPGSGIGLAICKKIVKLHRGEIWYESRPGDGTTFYFTIGKGHTPNT
ncbi:sensor histidine kinase [Flavilitoribacter nigricans]|uniref:histidine kinase n=1 Tax=Flavilitoribacter nigricans (strain ATCC 23147 / DSM 23189 / NBRC 102662 / NCIMB 1420 / SS-2) TaxID=1122177 RepID=A0A2D0N5V1_FLAN2|nr:ATP-binding protein [Flavilitoribacter nigricans]PHN03881.1 PAS domain-containing sensor histidine kinase [Flavilitoribacter nigricans DSM 23189 = NBRC 102662]